MKEEDKSLPQVHLSAQAGSKGTSMIGQAMGESYSVGGSKVSLVSLYLVNTTTVFMGVGGNLC